MSELILIFSANYDIFLIKVLSIKEGSRLLKESEKMKNEETAFVHFQDSFSNYSLTEKEFGEEKRKIDKLEAQKEEEWRKLRVAAANYFTKDIIIKIHKLSEGVLKCNDFSEEDYITRFSNISTIKYEDIHFLYERQQEINSTTKELGLPIQLSELELTKSNFWIRLGDILGKGGADNDN